MILLLHGKKSFGKLSCNIGKYFKGKSMSRVAITLEMEEHMLTKRSFNKTFVCKYLNFKGE